MNLKASQAEFCRALQHLPSKLKENSSDSMLIYHHNWLMSLVRALSHCYPLIEKLLGEDFFYRLAQDYALKTPSTQSNLHDYGQSFATYLASHPALKAYVYLNEVAHFEWTCHQLADRAGSQSVVLEKLIHFPRDQYGTLCFSLHPTCELMMFQFPLPAIIEFCLNPTDSFTLAPSKTYLLISRPKWRIEWLSLTLGEFTFLTAIKQGHSLLGATERALMEEPLFTLGEPLRRWIKQKVFVDCFMQPN